MSHEGAEPRPVVGARNLPPHYIQGRTDVSIGKPSVFAYDRCATVGTDDEVGVKIFFSCLRACTDSDDPLVFEEQIFYRRATHDAKSRALAGFRDHHLEKFDLGDRLDWIFLEGVRGQLLLEDPSSIQIEGNGVLDLLGDAAHGLAEPHFLDGLDAGRHEYFATEFARKVTLPFQQGDVDATMGEEEGERCARRSGSDDEGARHGLLLEEDGQEGNRVSHILARGVSKCSARYGLDFAEVG